MFELNPLNFTRNGLQFITTQKIIDKKLSFPESSKVQTSRLTKNASDLFEKTLFNKSEELKKLKIDENKRYKFEKVALKRQEFLNKNQFDLIINIEKKPMYERSPEIEKKPLLRSSLKQNTPFKTFYSKKKSKKNMQLENFQSSQREKPAICLLPRQFNTYDTWKLSQGLVVTTKVFIIAGTYPDIRKALLMRGWFENNDCDSIYFDLKWARNARVPSSLFDWQMINHFPRNFELSVKWQLYENIRLTNRVTKSNYLTFIPRSFRLDSKGSEDFLECFRAIYSVSLLQSFLKSPAKHLLEHVIISNQILKRWLCEVEKQNQCYEKYGNISMNVEWKILSCKDPIEVKTMYQRCMISAPSDIYSSVKSNLEKLEDLDPQFFLNGSKNIWIVKAGRKSRGRDIVLFNDLNKLKLHTSTSNAWVVQKYIENPLIICNKKFDIRQWVLISNSDPLTIWVYKKCYLRFSLEDYSDDNIQNVFIHLTNNSISKKSSKFGQSEIKGCMWDIQKFQQFLKDEKGEDFWTSRIFPQIKKIVKYSLLAVGNLGRKNSFEILGYDFMIDEQLKPWLLEINSSPAMDYSTVSIM
jgi:tubulin monoglycylase TTLL3/8